MAAPTAPSHVSASVDSSSVTVTWSYPDNDYGSAVTGYTIYNSDGTTQYHAAANATSYMINSATLTKGATYSFRIRAANAIGSSGQSTSSNDVQIPATKSDPPTGLVQAPGTAGVSQQLILNWTAPTITNGSDVYAYNLYQSIGGSDFTFISAIPSLTTATITGLTDGSGYTFQVSAVNGAGESDRSTSTSTLIPYQVVSLSASNVTQTYTGSPLSITVMSNPAGAPISVTYSGNHTKVGSYDVSAVVTGNAFSASPYAGTFTIIPATATIDASNLTQAWTGSPLHPTITTTPSGLATTIHYASSHTDPGACSFTVDISDSNYIGSTSDTLAITVAPAALQSTVATILATTTTTNQGSLTPIALSYAATAASLMQGITSVTSIQASTTAATVIAAIQTETNNSLSGTFLSACAAINATKTSTTDSNAVSNASALVSALQDAYPQGNSTVFSGTDVTTLLTNVTTSGTLPTSIDVIVADSTNIIDMRDIVDAYYSPMVPGTSYTLLTPPQSNTISGSTVTNVVYSAVDQTLSVNGTPYTVGSTVPLGFQSFRLYAIGTVGFANATPITVTGVTNVKSGTSAIVSWTVPSLGFTPASIKVTPTVNGTTQAPVSVSSGTSYTLANQAGNVVSFAIAMVASDGSVSGSVTSNSDTVPSSSSAPCFPKGTPILTPTGYKAVETLQQGSLVLTADGRQVPLKLYGRLLPEASERSAPYFIPKGALGSNRPSQDLTLSPDHAFLLRKGVWMLPKKAAELSKKVRQLGIGEPVHYYHVECPHYLRDNLVVNGCTVESYAGKQLDFVSPYLWSESLKGYTRTEKAATKSKAAHA